MRTYTVILEPDRNEGGFAVHMPALPGLHTQGDTLDEALENAREAIQGYLEALAKDGDQAPLDVPAISAQIAVEAA